jgi:chaperone required for assembly of F1-ATPase
LNDVAVIFEDGKVKDALIEYESEESVIKFFQKNNLIPKIITDDVKSIMKDVKNVLNSEYSMIYIPYENYDLIEEQNKIFKDIASEYSIDYKKIDAYLLGYNQKETINTTCIKISFYYKQYFKHHILITI